MQILNSVISTGLFAVAFWAAGAVVRTAFELRAELQPVRVQQRPSTTNTPRSRRPLRRVA
jgi:hypothetical protein